MNAWAGPGSIQGIVKDAQGKPIKGADVRIESRDGKQLFNTIKTDTQGHYISQGLQPGVYRVSLVVNGAVKAAIGNTKTKSDQPTQLNFDLKPASAGSSNCRAKERGSIWSGCPRAQAVIRVAAGSKFLKWQLPRPASLNVKKGSAEALLTKLQQLTLSGGGEAMSAASSTLTAGRTTLLSWRAVADLHR